MNLLDCAAERGDASVQFNLALMYEYGKGVPQDYVRVLTPFNLADAKGDEDARQVRDRLAKKMSAEQVAEAQRRAREWKPKSWEESKGHPEQKSVPSSSQSPTDLKQQSFGWESQLV